MPAPLLRHSSEPKLRSEKDEIMRIAKVKQILQKDRHIYAQDIEKRLQLVGTIRSEIPLEQRRSDLQDLRKPVLKKTKRHKTNFKIPLTKGNVESLNNLLTAHISQNQYYKNGEVVHLG